MSQRWMDFVLTVVVIGPRIPRLSNILLLLPVPSRRNPLPNTRALLGERREGHPRVVQLVAMRREAGIEHARALCLEERVFDRNCRRHHRIIHCGHLGDDQVDTASCQQMLIYPGHKRYNERRMNYRWAGYGVRGILQVTIGHHHHG